MPRASSTVKATSVQNVNFYKWIPLTASPCRLESETSTSTYSANSFSKRFPGFKGVWKTKTMPFWETACATTSRCPVSNPLYPTGVKPTIDSDHFRSHTSSDIVRCGLFCIADPKGQMIKSVVSSNGRTRSSVFIRSHDFKKGGKIINSAPCDSDWARGGAAPCDSCRFQKDFPSLSRVFVRMWILWNFIFPF